VNDSSTTSEIHGLAGLLLAAGQSTRLGEPKQFVMYHDLTLVEHAVNQALPYCGAGLVVVTGAHQEGVVSALQELPVDLVFNPDWAEGMGSSIRTGVNKIDEKCRAIMLLLCDQPLISREDYSSLVNAWVSKPECIAVAEYAGTRGAPAIFPSIFREALMQLSGEEGAKRIIDSAPRISAVTIPSAVFDVDTPGDLGHLS
jgi:molybdenum cofactor cytidylyltransferase